MGDIEIFNEILQNYLLIKKEINDMDNKNE